MKVVKRTRYIADCGKGYWSKSSAMNHELNCKCWTNPKYRTCKTCKFGKQQLDSNGMESEPQFLQTWKQWSCSNPLFNFEKHFMPAHKNAPDLNIYCPVWEQK